ncbi:MAG: N-acetyltransferase [Candidatus Binatia bacterium]|nr:MAG: N-acetyltransferase [Candidatus Binatia bacterium]
MPRLSPAKAPEVLVSQRLLLRRPRASDAMAIFVRYASDPEVTRYLSWPRHRSVADTRRFLAWSRKQWLRWPCGPYLVFGRRGEELLGGTGLTFESENEASTGYVLARDAWGFGYATEALEVMIDLASWLGLVRLLAFCHPDHKASQRVLEKCGFACEGRLEGRCEFPNLSPGKSTDVLAYCRPLR